jgi:organic radical activating enzyme
MTDSILANSRRADLVSDKNSNDGHRAFYLGQKDAPRLPFEAEKLVTLSETATLSDEEKVFLDDIVLTMRNEARLPFNWTPQEQHFVQNNPEEKLIPYLLYRYRFQVLPHRHAVSSFPVHLLIEPTSVCNLRCPMCFQSDKSFRSRGLMGLMDFELYKDVIDQAADEGAGAISLGSRGEPFLHPRLGDMLRYASEKQKFFDLKINTNATKMDEQACHDLLSGGVNVITLSIDAEEKNLYEEIRVRAKFEEVLENVERLVRIREIDYPSSSAEIRVSGVQFREEQNNEKFNAFWSGIVDTVAYVRAQQRWDTYNNPVEEEKQSPCSFLWERLYVWFDGKTNPCDEDYKSILSPGSVREQSISKIWNGQAMKQLREDHLNNRRACHAPCDRCGV